MDATRIWIRRVRRGTTTRWIPGEGVGAAERRRAAMDRRAARPQPLLQPLPWGLVRAPLLPVDACPAGRPDDGVLNAEPRLRAALAVASDSLFASLRRAPRSTAEAARRQRSLLRYAIRMTTRATPYGLFAGVGLVGWGSTTDVTLTRQLPRTRSRPDMGWLMSLVTALERDPDIRCQLRLF